MMVGLAAVQLDVTVFSLNKVASSPNRTVTAFGSIGKLIQCAQYCTVVLTDSF